MNCLIIKGQMPLVAVFDRASGHLRPVIKRVDTQRHIVDDVNAEIKEDSCRAQLAVQPLPQRHRLFDEGLAVRIVEQHGKVVSAHPGKRQGRKSGHGQSGRGAQQLVTGVIAEGIIEGLETPDIERDHGAGKRLPVLLQDFFAFGRELVEIAEAGYRVDIEYFFATPAVDSLVKIIGSKRNQQDDDDDVKNILLQEHSPGCFPGIIDQPFILETFQFPACRQIQNRLVQFPQKLLITLANADAIDAVIEYRPAGRHLFELETGDQLLSGQIGRNGVITFPGGHGLETFRIGGKKRRVLTEVVRNDESLIDRIVFNGA